MMRKGRITRIVRENTTSCAVLQRVTKPNQRRYDSSNYYHGGNGTYFHDYKTEPHINLYLTVYEDGENEEEHIVIDIREDILERNNLQRVSEQKLKYIQENNVGKKVSFDLDLTGTITFQEPLQL